MPQSKARKPRRSTLAVCANCEKTYEKRGAGAQGEPTCSNKCKRARYQQRLDARKTELAKAINGAYAVEGITTEADGSFTWNIRVLNEALLEEIAHKTGFDTTELFLESVVAEVSLDHASTIRRWIDKQVVDTALKAK